MTVRNKKRCQQAINLLSCCLFFITALTACGSSGHQFKLEGQFKNLNQGEFYLYDYEQGNIDTIAVNDGRFVYNISTHDTTTLVLLFPNYSEIPIFVQPGTSLTVKGDASHLRETDVKGDTPNEMMTAFRLKTNEMTPPQVEQEATNFISQNPASPVSSYLLRRYFLQSLTPDYPKALSLCSLMVQSQPHNVSLARLHAQLQTLSQAPADGMLPSFSAVTMKGDTITDLSLRGKPTVIIAWASWYYDSYSIFRRLQPLLKEHPYQLAVLSVSMDASRDDCQRIISRDSITWPNVCDQLMWQSPLVDSLGISTLPDNILVNRSGHIVARSLSETELMEKLKSIMNVH